MTILQSAIVPGGTTGYNIQRSLRFRSSASAYLSRTPASAGNRQIATWSGWVKRGLLSSNGYLFSSNDGGSAETYIEISAGDQLNFAIWTGSAYSMQVRTTQVFRDPSAWYHIVCALDTTQATASNRAKIYVNGVQVTALANSDYPTQNLNTGWNNTNAHNIGRSAVNAGRYFDGYLAEVNFIDGQALTPSSFGSTNALTGVWQPAAYTGSYGTNGFYLPFTDNSALTSGSNAGLGKDFSGNGNYWNTNNISITSGVTYDSMTDVPTLTSATQANYAVMNPLALGTSQTSLTQGNLYAIPTSGGSNWGTVFSTIAIPTSGKWYIEATAVVYAGSGNVSSLGVVNGSTFIPTNTTILYNYTTGEGFDGILCQLFSDYVAPVDDGVVGTNVTGITGTSVNLMLALDVDAGKVFAGYNGTWLNSGNPAAGTGQVALRTFSASDVVAGNTSWNGTNDQAQYFNFGQRPFAYTPPSGFVALNTFNLPTPTIQNGAAYMAASLYTGTGANGIVVTNTVGSTSFQPDFSWIKSRSTAGGSSLSDSVRGVNKHLTSNVTNAEDTETGTAGLQSYNSNGFTMGTQNAGAGDVNANGTTYVAWQWKAGTTSSSNTNGSITSTVSANTTAGFSIVTYTGTGANATVGHGLGVAPSMIICKSRNGTYSWVSYHKSLGASAFIELNSTAAATTGRNDVWNATSPTSTVFSVGTVAGNNNSGSTYVAYCFAPIAGYSAFGSYTGNGSTDGPFVFTNFRPRFLMLKRTDSSDNWYLYDTARDTFNVVDRHLHPNLSNAEGTGLNFLDILSNGFKLKQSYTALNASGGTYIYAAFAENPFKYALAR